MVRWLLHAHLRLSYSSELGAALAYRGHARSVHSATDKETILKISDDEHQHREHLLAIMSKRGLHPWFPLEYLFWLIGSTVGVGCSIWGEWASAFGASILEINGISEYQRIAKLAKYVGDQELIEIMTEFAENERVHHNYFAELSKQILRGRP